MTTVYEKRRASIAKALKAAGGGIALLPTAPEAPRNRDSDFPYRHDSYFYYLTGFTEPGSWTAFASAPKRHLAPWV
jgi:Xaa-Pro aminopeptidase